MKKLILLIITLIIYGQLAFAAERGDISPINTTEQSSNNFNLKLNAIGLLINLGDLTIEYKVSQNMTFSSSFLIGSFETKSGTLDFDIKTIGGNLRANWYYHGAFSDSFYASLYGGHLKFDVKLNNASTDADLKFSTPYIGAMIGYGWFWNNLNLTFGAGYNHAFEDDEAKISVDGIVGTTTVRVHTKIAIEASIGWAF